jgi:hypothetical protein
MRVDNPKAPVESVGPVENLSGESSGSATVVRAEHSDLARHRLETVPDYEVWKPESMAGARSIGWQQVNTLRDHLDELPADQ